MAVFRKELLEVMADRQSWRGTALQASIPSVTVTDTAVFWGKALAAVALSLPSRWYASPALPSSR